MSVSYFRKKYHITVLEEAFLSALFDPMSDSYLIPARAFRRARPLTQNSKAGAKRMMMKKRVALAAKEIMEASGFDLEERVSILKKIASGELKTEIRVYDKDGALVSKTERDPSVKDVLGAIQIANKLDGSYEASKVAVNLEKERLLEIMKATKEARNANESEGKDSVRLLPEKP